MISVQKVLTLNSSYYNYCCYYIDSTETEGYDITWVMPEF